MKPFLKWAGGKRWLVSNYANMLDAPDGRYIEPFLGSGAVFFYIEPHQAVLSDSNGQLIETYQAIRDEPDSVLQALKRHQCAHSEGHYYHVRESRPRTLATRAARFIYLNRTCFNGLYRVNLKGQFNVPKGTKNTVLMNDDDFSRWSELLKHAELVTQDFEKTIADAKEGDFLYIDPPYTVQHNNNNFLKYNEHIFSWADQIRLSECLTAVMREGVRILISNADHPSVRELYASPGWTHLAVDRHSKLASLAIHRRPTTEVIISNFASKRTECI